MKASDFTLHSIQSTAFVGSNDLRPDQALRSVLRSDWGELFDATPVTIPVPSGAPPEIPEVILSSQDMSHSLQISRDRISIVWQRQPSSMDVSLHDWLDSYGNHLVALFQQQHRSIGRIAAVANRVVTIENPAKAIADHFFQGRWINAPLNRPAHLEVHSHKVYPFPTGYRVNSWVRIRAVAINSHVPNVVSVEQDLNSLDEERRSRRFSKSDVDAFYAAASSELSVILNLYFPEE